MHDAPLSLLSAQPLKLIFTLLHITAALLPVSFIILAYCFLVLSFVYSENFKAEVKALHSLPGSIPQAKMPHWATKPIKWNQHLSLGVHSTLCSPDRVLQTPCLSNPYLHIVPCCLSSVLHAAFQPQWGSQGSVLGIHTQPSSYIANLKQQISRWISCSYQVTAKRKEDLNCLK